MPPMFYALSLSETTGNGSQIYTGMLSRYKDHTQKKHLIEKRKMSLPA